MCEIIPLGLPAVATFSPSVKVASGMENRGINCRQITIYPYNMLG